MALRALRHARRMTEPARMPPVSPWNSRSPGRSSGQRAFTYSTANVYQVIEADLERWDTGSPVAMTKASPFPVARMSSERKPSARAAVPKGSRQRLPATTQRTVYVVFRAPL